MPTTLSTPSTSTKNTKDTNSLFCHKEIFVANSRTFCDTFYVLKYCGGVGYQKLQGLEIRCTRSHHVGQFHTKKKVMNS